MPRPRRLVLAVGAIALAVALAAGASGRYDEIALSQLDTAAERALAPGWTKPCWKAPDYLEDRCARVTGRVIWKQEDDPDGDGDRHLILISRLHVRIVKLKRTLPGRVPGIGGIFRGTGGTQLGASGRTEIDILAVRR